MAVRSLGATTWERGVAEPSATLPAWADLSNFTSDTGESSHYDTTNPEERTTCDAANGLGTCRLRTWPDLFNGTAGSHVPDDRVPASEVDVLICGAGPFGLAVAIGLARQGISFRIIDKAFGPCHTGRADAVHPRALELLDAWGLADEIADEGPLLNRFTLHRDGVTLANTYTVPAETTKYRGLHVAAQGQIERIYIRDLLRYQVLVERGMTLESYEVDQNTSEITARLSNSGNQEQIVKSRYIVGSDGASSRVRELAGISFEGLATDCFFAIIDCQLKTDYPHILDTGWVSTADHGCAIFVPREQNHTRVYLQLTGQLQQSVVAAHKRSKEARHASAVGETQVHDHGLIPNDVMEQLKKVMAPWNIDFAGPLSWFAIWRVNERVARSFSTPDHRVHLGGDAAHVHSTIGAFGYNSTVYDASNLSWKLGLCIDGAADPAVLLPTYDIERRLFSNQVIRYSGALLRFICRIEDPLPELRGVNEEFEEHQITLPNPKADNGEAGRWLGSFFHDAPPILMSGLGFPLTNTILSHSSIGASRPVKVANGVRAPNPRVALRRDSASYLYDALQASGSRFHLLVFASDLQGPIRHTIAKLAMDAFGSGGFYQRYGGSNRFKVTLLVKAMPYNIDKLMAGQDLEQLRNVAQVVYDDRAPDEDAHYFYAVNHARGAVVVVRPDLVVATSAWPDQTTILDAYFGSFLLEI